MFAILFAIALSPQVDVQMTIETYLKAVQQYDAITLDRLFEPDYQEISPLGEQDDRKRTLSFYQVAPYKRGLTPTSMNVAEFSVRFPAKDVAVAVYRQDLQIDRRGQPMTMSFRVTSVLKRGSSGWRLLSNHFNGIRKPV